MTTGIVKMFHVEKGFGFITPDDGSPEIFVHQSNITGTGFRYLLPGEPVEFDTERDQKKDRLQALKVRPPAGRKRGTVKKFDHFKGFGFITPDDGSPDLFFHHTNIISYKTTGRLTAEEGEAVWFETESGIKGPQAARVKREDSRQPLFRFADMGKEEDWLPLLAAKSEPESWQHSVKLDKYTDYPILKSYLLHTFARLEQEDLEAFGKKIAIGRDGNRAVACFNTGLVTPNQEEIFALFSGKPQGNDGRNWKLAGFHSGSDHKILGKFDSLPELVNYFDDPRVLLYDRRRELYIDIDHVLDDNIGRFPKQLQDQKFVARQSLVAAKTQTQQRVYRNYKTAVPQFHRGEVQLLLPLCLMKPGVADLALVVSTKEGQYRGDTILTLDMAYSNARLLCRPDSDWLKP